MSMQSVRVEIVTVTPTTTTTTTTTTTSFRLATSQKRMTLSAFFTFLDVLVAAKSVAVDGGEQGWWWMGGWRRSGQGNEVNAEVVVVP